MAGLSQLELDALCCVHEGHVDEPSSPVGSALLARKRQRQGQREMLAVSAVKADMDSTLCEVGAERALGSTGPGLSQAMLDEMSMPEQPTEEPYAGSPIGSALLSVKNRRCFGTFLAQQPKTLEVAAGYVIDNTVTAPSAPTSWGVIEATPSSGTGLTQAQLDAMCGEEPGPETALEEPSSPMRTTSAQKASSVRSSPTQTIRDPQLPSPCGSPPMRRRRARRADAENATMSSPNGKATTWDSMAANSRSPLKEGSLVSPGKGEDLSPQRRSNPWGSSSPLSPVRFN